MTEYNNFPTELAKLFPIKSVTVPFVIREVFREGWSGMDPTTQKDFIRALKREKDIDKRVLKAVTIVTRRLLSQPTQ
jgi:hypothetical protein